MDRRRGMNVTRMVVMVVVVPVIGLAIIAYVIVNADTRAQITAAAWLLFGAAIHFVRRARTRP